MRLFWLPLFLGWATHAAAAGDMSFEAVAGAAIAASGRITEDTPQAFVDSVRRIGRGAAPTVYLDSSGGTVTAAMQLGALFRKAGVTAVVGKPSQNLLGSKPGVDKGECLSACVYALMGARRRIIPGDSDIGIHKLFVVVEGQQGTYATTDDAGRTRGVVAALRGYAGRMGVSPNVIARAETMPSGNMYLLTRAEINKWRLSTEE